MLIVGDDHPRACTGRRLLRLRLAREYAAGSDRRVPPVVLDPYSRDPISRSDYARAARAGVLAIDCSWNALARRGRLPPSVPSASDRRRLPYLVAGNPQHFGRLGELNTVEALGAAICLLGRASEAEELLRGFAGGPAFLAINRERLQRFAQAESAEEQRALEREVYGSPSPD